MISNDKKFNKKKKLPYIYFLFVCSFLLFLCTYSWLCKIISLTTRVSRRCDLAVEPTITTQIVSCCLYTSADQLLRNREKIFGQDQVHVHSSWFTMLVSFIIVIVVGFVLQKILFIIMLSLDLNLPSDCTLLLL